MGCDGVTGVRSAATTAAASASADSEKQKLTFDPKRRPNGSDDKTRQPRRSGSRARSRTMSRKRESPMSGMSRLLEVIPSPSDSHIPVSEDRGDACRVTATARRNEHKHLYRTISSGWQRVNTSSPLGPLLAASLCPVLLFTMMS